MKKYRLPGFATFQSTAELVQGRGGAARPSSAPKRPSDSLAGGFVRGRAPAGREAACRTTEGTKGTRQVAGGLGQHCPSKPRTTPHPPSSGLGFQSVSLSPSLPFVPRGSRGLRASQTPRSRRTPPHFPRSPALGIGLSWSLQAGLGRECCVRSQWVQVLVEPDGT
jgi:hypothetical protein